MPCEPFGQGNRTRMNASEASVLPRAILLCHAFGNRTDCKRRIARHFVLLPKAWLAQNVCSVFYLLLSINYMNYWGNSGAFCIPLGCRMPILLNLFWFIPRILICSFCSQNGSAATVILRFCAFFFRAGETNRNTVYTERIELSSQV